ncbi:MAG TPA: NAD(P)-binding domain-containing protein, partial [Anaerolineae bacterium]|nr:NAD(P)-binding domain-containing protein [Anaerolineae bacterium]
MSSRRRRMELAIIGLGRMGGNIARRLIRAGHRIVGYNRSADVTRQIAAEGLEAAFSLNEVVQKLNAPRVVWLMLPAG